MNYTFVVLGIILLIVLYVLYMVFTEKKTELSSYKKLSGQSVSYSDLQNPSSTKYYISMWVYVVKSSGTQILYTVNKSSGTASFKVQLIDSKLEVTLDDGSSTVDDKITLTENFPLQRWTCVVVSVNADILDAYLDGKLVKSIKPNSWTNSTLDVNSDVTEGSPGSTNEIYIAKFERIPQAIDASAAWDKYMAGNGGNGLVQFLKRYGISLVLTKDSTEQSKLTFPP